ncbi:hypothetical protein FACS189420_3620 [Bacteroidia bacterium]|nr:hypothetical protein FACS189420_3620 [Bacteroidia bacterium]
MVSTAKTFTINGNSIVLDRSGITSEDVNQRQTLRITHGSANVTINRVHFTNATTNNSGAAIDNRGTLTLQSCLLSNNQSNGAIYNNNTLVARGCTFYNNRSSNQGGAIYNGSAGKLTLIGNLFWGNIAPTGSVIFRQDNSTITSSGYNVSDKATGTDATTGSGFTFAEGDKQISVNPVSPITYRPLLDSEVIGVLTSPPSDYPATDFYGETIPTTDAAAGAVQTPVTEDGYTFSIPVHSFGTVAISGGTADGIFTSGNTATLTATANAGYVVTYWVVNDVQIACTTGSYTSTATLSITMNEHKTVQAVFGLAVINNNDSGEGSLRQAINDVSAGGVIAVVLPEGSVIALESPLQGKNVVFTIEGNGVTLDGGGINRIFTLFVGYNAQNITINRVHFTNGRVTGGNGGAILTSGRITLQSCIFSNNQSTDGNGGAIMVNPGGNVTIRACTFFNNSAAGRGGAISLEQCAVNFTGNLFWGNTILDMYMGNYITWSNGGYNVSDKESGTNATTGSGFTFTTSDVQTTSLPVSPATFRLMPSSEAGGVINTIPTDYPAFDFYDNPISSLAASGAVQATVAETGNALTLLPHHYGTVAKTGGETANDDGLFTSGSSIILTATANVNRYVYYWIVNGERMENTSSNPLASTATLELTMDGHKTVSVVYGITVTSTDNAGVGSLRQALSDVFNGSVIRIDLTAGSSINPISRLQTGAKTFTIEGNGVTLDGSGITPSTTSQILINSAGANVTINRVHFTNGKTTDNGGAIVNSGTLILQSCIFSNNQATATTSVGGAICSGSTNISIRGCTFYNNVSSYGGAIYLTSGSGPSFTGNLFYGNTAINASPVIGNQYQTVTSGGYNVSDKETGTNATTGSGFTFAEGDRQISVNPVSPVSFRLLPGSEAAEVITTIPANYPTVDFYGEAISTNAAAGAVQTTTAEGYALVILTQNMGTIEQTGGVAANSDGLYAQNANVTLTATANDGYIISHWLVNGERRENTSNPFASPATLNLTMDGHKTVQAVFGIMVTSADDSSSAATTAGTLRYAIANVPSGGVIIVDLPAGSNEIVLTNPLLLSVAKVITMNGQGVTISGSGITESANSQILRITSGDAKVTINRVHFTNGKATTNGGAIDNRGTLTLQSCIFSNNQTTAINANGGAIYTDGSGKILTVLGCTFYNNRSGNQGGAIRTYFTALTITGNLFWGNTAPSGSVIYTQYSSVTSGGYNVSDKETGTNATTGSGFTFVASDIQETTLPFNTTTFAPVLTSVQIVPAGVADFPATDFNGTARTFPNGAAGAVETSLETVTLTLAKGRNWYLSSPVTAAKANTAFAAAGFVEYYDEPRTTPYSASESTIDGWVNITGTTNTLVPGKGYVVHAEGTGEATYTFTGIPNTGDVNVELTRSTGVAKEGFNLVGNPYLSYIDWEAVSSENSSLVGPTIWYRTKTDAYQFYTHNSASGLSDPVLEEYSLQYIPPMQGFWVRAANAGTLKFTEGAKVDNETAGADNGNLLRQATGNKRPLVRLQLADGGKTDRAVIFADKNAKDGFDRYDSEKIFGSGAAIYTVAGNEKLIFNGLSAISAGTEIPLGFTTDHSGEYSIAAIAVQDLDGFEVILKDNSQATEFSLTGGETYRFTSEITDNTSRFSVILREQKSVTSIASVNGKVSVYASNNTLYVQSPVAVKRVRVYNLVGKLLYSTKESVINNVSSGVCIVKVETENGTVSRKVTVN